MKDDIIDLFIVNSNFIRGKIMNIFVVHSGADFEIVSKKIDMYRRKCFDLNALVLKNGNVFWKLEAASKIRKSQLVVFFVGENSYKSPYIGWELKQAMKYKKTIYTIKLNEEYEIHSILNMSDTFSDFSYSYSHEISEDELLSLVSKYEEGDYEIFNDDPKNLNQDVLLEQYKLFLKTSEDLVSRRQNVNNFYISINSALIALMSAIIAIQQDIQYKAVILSLFAFMGIVLSISWIRILISYGNLNSSKMKIISNIEKRLPASLYDAEWAALSDNLNKKKYVSFTENEKSIPKIFMIIYFMIILGVLFKIFFS